MEVTYVSELAEIPEARLAAALGVDTRLARSRRKALSGLHGDASWVRARVEELPAEALAVAHLLAARGGSLPPRQLDDIAQRDFAMTAADVERGLAALAAPLLAMELSEYGYSMVTLLAPAAHLLVAAIAGMDIPPLHASPFVADERGDRRVDHRAYLAVCTAAAHAELKVTRGGDPHLTTTKRLAKQVGVEDELISRALSWGERLGLVHAEDQRLCCDARTLRTVATAAYEHDPVLAAIAAELQRAPAPRRDVERWVHASSVHCMCEDLGRLQSFQPGTVAGAPAVAWQPPSGAATSYVTPSFEVFVPPEARLIDVVEVGL